MGIFSWMTSRSRLRAQVAQTEDVFGDEQCRVVGLLSTNGFGDMYLPDRFRWISARATCECRVAARQIADPYILIRAIPSRTDLPVVLSIRFNGVELADQPVPGYGTYYFPIPASALGKVRREWAGVELQACVGNSVTSPENAAVALYEARVIDAAHDDFPDKHEFAGKLSLFTGAGGHFFEAMSQHPFRPEHRLLEVGSGEGHLALLTSAFSGASVTGIDVCEYEHGQVPTVEQRLMAEFRLHRSMMPQIPGLEVLTNPDGLSATMRRTNYLTMSAEEMRFSDESFDFIYSLNVMEHIGNPERALQEMYRVLRPGGRVLLQYSPLYYSDSGSHLPGTLGLNRPWAQLVMTRDEIKRIITESGGVTNEVDNILDSLNGWPPQRYYDAFERSQFKVVLHESLRGFTMDGSGESPEYSELRKTYSEIDLTTYAMSWVLEKPH
jgi:SAM-dependent methyltransferase